MKEYYANIQDLFAKEEQIPNCIKTIAFVYLAIV